MALFRLVSWRLNNWSLALGGSDGEGIRSRSLTLGASHADTQLSRRPFRVLSGRDQGMSKALEEACAALQVAGQGKNREIIAVRIIELARKGVIDATVLRDRVVEAMRSL